MQGAESQTAASTGRSCGTCTLCCKVYDVPAAGTVAGSWCRHCAPGQGCRIWSERPDQCRAFDCLWLTQDWLGPEWKPETAKIVFTMDPTTRFLQFQVDPGAPNAWRREPYYSQIKRWAIEGFRQGRYTLVFVNKSATMVLPDQDAPIGVLGPQDRVTVKVGVNGRSVVEVQRG